MDNVNIPATPAVPSTPAPAANAEAPKIAGEVKGSIPEAPKGDINTAEMSKAEKAVVQKIKVGDLEYDQTTLEAMIEKAKGADKKFLEAAKQRKEAVKFFKLAKENPKEFLRKTGIDPQKFAYDEVAEDIKNKLRDPREVELEAAQKRLKEFEAKEAAEKARLKAEREEKAAKAFEEKLHQKMIEALEETPTLPKNGFTVAKIAKYIETVFDKTGTMLEPKDVVKVIERDIQSEMKGILSGADAEKIIALIGEEGMAAIRKYDLAKLKDPLKNGNNLNNQQAKPEERKRVRSNDFWKEIDKQAKEERGEYYGRS